jgi:hypothetical protein
VGVSFALFAHDQVAGASTRQVNSLALYASPGRSLPPPHQTVQPRRFIDGAAKALTSPFAAVISSSNQWATRGVALGLALLVYGFGLGYLARYASGAA